GGVVDQPIPDPVHVLVKDHELLEGREPFVGRRFALLGGLPEFRQQGGGQRPLAVLFLGFGHVSILKHRRDRLLGKRPPRQCATWGALRPCSRIAATSAMDWGRACFSRVRQRMQSSSRKAGICSSVLVGISSVLNFL